MSKLKQIVKYAGAGLAVGLFVFLGGAICSNYVSFPVRVNSAYDYNKNGGPDLEDAFKENLKMENARNRDRLVASLDCELND